MNGADLLVRCLVQRGVSHISCLSGNGLNPLFVACRRAGVRIADFRNEQAAAYAADATARLTGHLAVCAASSGVAHVAALSGIANSWYDGAPVLLISGASDHARTGAGKFQDMDQVALAAPLCKYAALVERADRIPFHVQEACSRALAGRPGPAHLTVPLDVLEAEVADVAPVTPRLDSGVRSAGEPDTAEVRRTVDLLRAAERPVIVAGSGVFYARGGEELQSLAIAAGAPVVVPIWDRGVLDRRSEHFLGVIGAASGGPSLLPDSDLVLLVGARCDYRVGYLEPPIVPTEARVVRIDADSAELGQGREPDVAIQANPARALAAIASALREAGHEPRAAWLSEARARAEGFRAGLSESAPASSPLSGRQVVEALRPLICDAPGGSLESGDRPVFLVDGGNIGQWAHALLTDRYPGDWLTCGASGLVGWGLGGAIGAKLAYHDRPVLLLSGDGAIGFTIAELETAVRLGMPFVVVVADDRRWGIVASGQSERYGREGVIASSLGPVRYDRIAEACGGIGVWAETAEELASAVREGLRAERPTLIQVPISPGGPTDAR